MNRRGSSSADNTLASPPHRRSPVENYEQTLSRHDAKRAAECCHHREKKEKEEGERREKERERGVSHRDGGREGRKEEGRRRKQREEEGKKEIKFCFCKNK